MACGFLMWGGMYFPFGLPPWLLRSGGGTYLPWAGGGRSVSGSSDCGEQISGGLSMKKTELCVAAVVAVSGEYLGGIMGVTKRQAGGR